MHLTFGEFTFDSDRRQLFRGGEAIHVSPKAFAFLQLLIERRPKAVSREEIYEYLWPKTFVADSNLASLALEVRHALGDDARKPRFMRTVFGFGYAFIADAGAPSSPSRFRLFYGTTELPLPEGETILGRRTPALAREASVSREHARIVVTNEGASIEDLGSKNGTFVGGRRITTPMKLVDGDAILLGKVSLTFRAGTDPVSTMTVQRDNQT